MSKAKAYKKALIILAEELESAGEWVSLASMIRRLIIKVEGNGTKDRENIENIFSKWIKKNNVNLNTEQKHALLYGVIPEIIEGN